MGYRSDIALCLSKTAAEKLRNKRAAEKDEAKCYLCDHPDSHKIDAATGEELLRWYNEKWYDDFPDVAFINTFLTDLDDGEYLFIIVGENPCDIEIRGSFWSNSFNLSVETTIITH